MTQDRDANVSVGSNLRTLRRSAGLTQTELAAKMTDQGFPFKQQTVLKIEGGTRPLKLIEAAKLAQILAPGTHPAAVLAALIRNETGPLVTTDQLAKQQWEAIEDWLRDSIADLNGRLQSFEVLRGITGHMGHYAHEVPSGDD